MTMAGDQAVAPHENPRHDNATFRLAVESLVAKLTNSRSSLEIAPAYREKPDAPYWKELHYELQHFRVSRSDYDELLKAHRRLIAGYPSRTQNIHIGAAEYAFDGETFIEVLADYIDMLMRCLDVLGRNIRANWQGIVMRFNHIPKNDFRRLMRGVSNDLDRLDALNNNTSPEAAAVLAKRKNKVGPHHQRVLCALHQLTASNPMTTIGGQQLSVRMGGKGRIAGGLGRTLKDLREWNYVETERGANGGYRLTARGRQIASSLKTNHA